MTVRRAPEDAVWLAKSVPCGLWKGRILDAGCGGGEVILALRERCGSGAPGCEHVALTLLDVRADYVSAAVGRVRAAGLLDAVRVVGDVCTFAPPAPFGLIVTNPPFFLERTGHGAAGDKKGAHVAAEGLLAGWFTSLRGMLAEGGLLAAIVHPDTLPEVMRALAGMEVVLMPVSFVPGKAPARMIIHAFGRDGGVRLEM